MTTLRGMAWAHARATAPLAAANQKFAAANPGTRIEWEARPLSAFEETPLEELARVYDLITIDHPFVGTASRLGVLTPWEELLPDRSADQPDEGWVGRSAASYRYADQTWAIPIDAAAQVSAITDDALGQVGGVPRTLEEAVDAATRLKGAAVLPANPVHALSTVYSLSHQQVSADLGRLAVVTDWWGNDGPDAAVVARAVGALQSLLKVCSPLSLDLDPIDALEAMADGRAGYAPVVFGYVPYARKGFRAGLVHFHDAPTLGGLTHGTLLGGVGLAVSALSEHGLLAAEYARLASSESFQRAEYAAVGGQPARVGAWLDPQVNAESDDFYVRTLATLEGSFIRPRLPGYPAFQKSAAASLHAILRAGGPADKAAVELRRIWQGTINTQGEVEW